MLKKFASKSMQVSKHCHTNRKDRRKQSPLLIANQLAFRNV